ncbi:MAG: S1 RNA-binding domain-containing protein [Candidatus Paceibacterota bacterium]|nr:MAG: S1 RNA-binding domain-containing protein [Candidatus Paceibacterota bacterium]
MTQTATLELEREETSEGKTRKSVSEENSIGDDDKSLTSKFISEISNPPAVGDLVDGQVIDVYKNSVFVDLQPFGTGIIYGREFNIARDIIKNVSPGDNISGKIIDLEEKDGYFEISLKEARQAKVWSEAEEAIKSKSIFELVVQEANKGGLMLTWQGVIGFLPASQLNSEHYPRVADGDKDRILEELKKMVGQKLSVSIINASPKEGKLIFSEKSPELKKKIKIIEKYSVGDEVEGEITGVVDFGAFVKVEEGLEGLVHISEMDWGLVEDPKQMFKVGEKVRVKIIEVKDEKISLSIKALKKNPWTEAEKKYKKDDIATGVVIKFNKHGALASIEEGVAGLVHISEFGNESKLREKLSLGNSYKFKITLFEPKEQKMTLSYMEAHPEEKPATKDTVTAKE